MPRLTHTSGIYRITNLDNGKVYIGSASRAEDRICAHLSMLRKNSHHNAHLQRAFNKHGESRFLFAIIEVIDTPSVERLREREQWYLDNTECEYNIAKNATLSTLGLKASEESKRKNRDSQLGRKHTEATIQKMSASATLLWSGMNAATRAERLVKLHTPEMCRKISQAKEGLRLSEEVKRQRRETMRQKRERGDYR